MNIDLVKIKYKSNEYINNKSNESESFDYKYKIDKFCCKDFKYFFEKHCIIAGMNIFTVPELCVSTLAFEEQGYYRRNNTPIKFCPFCCDKIEKTLSEKDYTKQYSWLIQEKNRVEKEIEETDSKKKTSELTKYDYELIQKIDYCFNNNFSNKDVSDYLEFLDEIEPIEVLMIKESSNN